MTSPESPTPTPLTSENTDTTDQLALFNIDENGNQIDTLEEVVVDAEPVDVVEDEQSNEKVASVLQRIEADIINRNNEKDPAEAVKAVVVATGRSAAKNAVKHGKIWNFIDRIGINSPEQREKDGLLAKKLRARRDTRKAERKANKSSVLTEQIQTIDSEKSQELKVKEILGVIATSISLEQNTVNIPIQTAPLEHQTGNTSSSKDMKAVKKERVKVKEATFFGNTASDISKNEEKPEDQSWLDFMYPVKK